MRDAYRFMRLAAALLVGFMMACDAAEAISTSFLPSRRDDWPSVADWERPGPFLPAPLSDAEPPWGKCLPEVPRGPLYYSNPTLQIAAYESPHGRYFIERYGPVPVATDESLKALNTRLADKLRALPDWLWIGGVSLCSIGPPWPSFPPGCLGANAQIRRTTLSGLTDQIGDLLKDEGSSCIGVLLDVSGWDHPRCDPSDPGCLPISYCSFSAGPCEGSLPYRPSEPRSPVRELAGLTAGRCQHDGDCVQNGCGNHCTAYTNYGLPGTCPFYGGLVPAFCGCVDGECWWFKQ